MPFTTNNVKILFAGKVQPAYRKKQKKIVSAFFFIGRGNLLFLNDAPKALLLLDSYGIQYALNFASQTQNMIHDAIFCALSHILCAIAL